MNEPTSAERLARLRADNEPRGDHLSGLTADEVGEVLDEVERLQTQAAYMREQIEQLAQVGEERKVQTVAYRALAEQHQKRGDKLRAQLAEIGDEWSYETKNGWSGWQRCTTPMTEEYARKRAASSDRNRLVHRKAGEWRQVEQEAEPRLQCGCLGYCEGGPECLDDEGGPWPQEREVSE